jgi:mono/diheme cytochrome c family protein
MRFIYPLSALLFLLAGFRLSTSQVSKGSRSAPPNQERATSSPPDGAQVARGRYLVEEVAKCAECHTPRTATGQLDASQWLQGAPIWIEPIYPYTNWADHAPDLAGLPNYTDDQIARVLEQGIGVNGQALQPPMHSYHMNPADAQAIIAYLRSLPPSSQ